MSSCRISRIALANAVLALLVLLAGTPAMAGTTSWSGYEGATFMSGVGTSIGPLTLTANLDLTDNLGYNSGSSAIGTTDDWTFSVPSMASLGTTVTGYEVDLTNLAFSGTLDSVQLYSGTPTGTHTLLQTGTLIGGTFDGMTYDIENMGAYYVQVVATLAPSNSGSYTGTLLVASIPEPERLGLMSAGLAAVLAGVFVRRRRK